MSLGADRVLEALREAGDTRCSGADLSAQLGVSRAQIWKHVGGLRKRGYVIQGEPGGGYKLIEIPDRLYANEIARGLNTRWLGRTLQHLDETDSTNAVAQQLAAEGAPAGTAVIAEAQTAGRGRLGRSFYSPPHSNLYMSLVLRPTLEIAQAPTLLLAAGVAVAETVAAVLGDAKSVTIKWPNDVLLDGLKTSGILMELGAEETRISHAILGIGVNLNVDRAGFPDEFRERATSLASHRGGPVDRVDFTQRLLGALEDILDLHAEGGLAAVRPRFDAFFAMVGRAVDVRSFKGPDLAGIVAGIAADGALEIDVPSGERVRVLAGDVTLRPRPAA
jgi:BirA family biotin operon repressor/biotin-[acetyl-CoA-carboxylase] ligase